MNYIYIVVFITLFVTTISIIAFIGCIPKKKNENIDTMSQVQLNEDTFIINCVYDYRIKSFRMFVYSPPQFPNVSCLLEYGYLKVKCIYDYKPYRIFNLPYGHLIVKNEGNTFPKYIILNSTRVPIHIPYHASPIYNLDFCICKFVNYTAVNRFIQTIESYRLFGVDHFTLYLVNASTSVMKVINYYQSINIMEVVLGNETIVYNENIKNQMYGQIAKGDDCIYRNMKRSKGVIVADIDEIIWPVKHRTINEMLKSINGNYNYFTIRSFQFHTELVNVYDRWIHNVPDTDIFLYHEYCRYKQGYVQKNIYTKLDAIYSIFIHWLMDGTKELKRIYADYELAYIRHIRRLKYLKESACETNWTIMSVDPREKVINENTNKIRNLFQIQPPLPVNPPILKDISSPLLRFLYSLFY